jgi:hypothetical protein
MPASRHDVTLSARRLAPEAPAANPSPCTYETSDGVGMVLRGLYGNPVLQLDRSARWDRWVKRSDLSAFPSPMVSTTIRSRSL